MPFSRLAGLTNAENFIKNNPSFCPLFTVVRCAFLMRRKAIRYKILDLDLTTVIVAVTSI